MKKLLQLFALAVLVVGGALWLATGASRGWTKTSVPIKNVDEVTGLEGISYKRQFVPGVDFLGGVVLGASALGGASLLTRRQPKP